MERIDSGYSKLKRKSGEIVAVIEGNHHALERQVSGIGLVGVYGEQHQIEEREALGGAEAPAAAQLARNAQGAARPPNPPDAG